MLITVFTPSHDTRFLGDCHVSLRRQTWSDWEWVVLLNGDAADWSPAAPDERVRVIRDSDSPAMVGALKRRACELAQGEILLELDHDDMLAPTCLAEVADAFTRHPQAALVYSDWAQINEDASRNDTRFNEAMGWRYSEERIGSRRYLRCHAMAAYPHNVAYIWYAPNHVRAFRRSVYEQVGGYDGSLKVLDDQELMVRLYPAGEFVHIDRCLYLQRVHPANTQVEPATNAFIQEQTVRYYRQHIQALACAWADRHGLATLTLRTPTSPQAATLTAGQPILLDPHRPALGVADESVGVILAGDLLQRVAAPIELFNACFDAMPHGGLMLTQTPSTDGRGAFQDPSHLAYYNENSFWYVTQAEHLSSVPDLRARFMVSQLRTHHPTPWHEQVKIPYVEANLLAVKDGPRQGGPLLW